MKIIQRLFLLISMFLIFHIGKVYSMFGMAKYLKLSEYNNQPCNCRSELDWKKQQVVFVEEGFSMLGAAVHTNLKNQQWREYKNECHLKGITDEQEIRQLFEKKLLEDEQQQKQKMKELKILNAKTINGLKEK